jgi:VanZ family protein
MRRQPKRKSSKYLLLLPVLLWMVFIFIFSSQSYEKQDLRPWLQSELSDKQIQHYFGNTHLDYGGHVISINALGVAGFVEFFIRKSAHVTEYAVLGLLVLYCLDMIFPRKRGLFLMAIGFCVLYAATDEYHQSFISGRTPMAVDVVLDTTGALIGTLVYLFVFKGISFMYKKLTGKS